MLVRVSAPAKVILHGEHAVVHNKLALAAAIELRTSINISESQHTFIVLKLNNLDIELKIELNRLLQIISELFNEDNINKYDEDLEKHICPQLLEHVKRLTEELLSTKADLVENPKYGHGVVAMLYLIIVVFKECSHMLAGLDINVSSDIPVGAGLGSSAALCVATAGALIRLKSALISTKEANSTPKRRRENDQFSEAEIERIGQLAFLGETILHGRPSGVDNTVISRGGLLSFRRSCPMELRSRRFPSNLLRVLLINSGVERDTSLMVARVTNLVNVLPDVANNLLIAMDKLAEDACNIYEELDRLQSAQDEMRRKKLLDRLDILVSANQGMLYALGVSHPRLDSACNICLRFGIRAKLTGAGGGGFAIALVNADMEGDRINALIEELRANDFDVCCAEIGAQGVRIDDVGNVSNGNNVSNDNNGLNMGHSLSKRRSSKFVVDAGKERSLKEQSR